MTLKDVFLLGRASNLPTVWTNALTGLTLAGLAIPGDDGSAITLAFVILAMSLFYTGGMYLNDAFDAQYDADNRPERPIPAGRVNRRTVYSAGYTMLGMGLFAVLLAASRNPASGLIWAGAACLLLTATIIFYDWHHKENPLSPLVMGLCRGLVYVTAGLCVTDQIHTDVLLAGLVVLSYLIGLTYLAKQEDLGQVTALWPLVLLAAPVAFGIARTHSEPLVLFLLIALAAWVAFCVVLVTRGGACVALAVANLIAGIALCDAIFLALAGAEMLSLLAAACFLLTLALQRILPAT